MVFEDFVTDEGPGRLESSTSPNLPELSRQVRCLDHVVALNSILSRPADRWGALSANAEATREATKAKAPAKKKRRKTWSDRRPTTSRRTHDVDTEASSFHFIGYVPVHGKVWELDGLKSGPLEVGELPLADSTEGWEDIVRPALRLKMEKYGAGTDQSGNIQFSLLALVQDRYETKSDELELLRRQRIRLEKRLIEEHGYNWTALVRLNS